MFRYFTFKGILCSLKKLIIPAIVGVIVFALLGAGFAFSKAESDESGEITFSVEYPASRAYLTSRRQFADGFDRGGIVHRSDCRRASWQPFLPR